MTTTRRFRGPGKVSRRQAFERKYTQEPNTGCFLWTGGVDGHDYGVFWFARRLQRAHRVAWQMKFGRIPDGLNVLHRCDTPSCVNPDHLFLGTLSDNTQDAIKKRRHNNSKKTHCKRGHPLTGDNLFMTRHRRQCRECHNMRERRRVSA